MDFFYLKEKKRKIWKNKLTEKIWILSFNTLSFKYLKAIILSYLYHVCVS